MFKVCIFDLDGTIANSLVSIANSANKAIGKFGFNPNPIQNYNKYAGDGAEEMIKRSLIDAGDKNLFYFEEAFNEYKIIFEKECMYEVKPYDGIESVLNKLKEKNIKLSVLSNKPHDRAVDVVKGLFGDDLFDIVEGVSGKFKRKPDPQGALYIADLFKVKPEECAYFGDTNTDMITGKSAGMFTVGVLWGFRDRNELEENNADIIISNPSEILDIVMR